MWSDRVSLATGTKSKNPIRLNIPKEVADYDYFQVIIESITDNNDGLTWKLIDKSGCEQDLPFFYIKGELDVIIFTVNGYKDENNHNFAIYMKCWKKELQMPIPKYYSISTVEIVPKEKCAILPTCRSRKKDVNNWTYGSLVTFSKINTPHECQLYYVLPRGIIVKSQRFDVNCMCNYFNIDRECVNYEEIVMDNKFNLKLTKKSSYNIDYMASLTLLDPNTHEDYNKEKLIKSTTQTGLDRPNFPLIPDATYKFKIYVEKPNVVFKKEFRVPVIQPADQMLWTKKFGEADRVLFGRRDAKRGIQWINYWTGEGNEIDMEISVFRLTLHKNGKYFVKRTYQKEDGSAIVTQYSCGGSFVLLSTLNSENLLGCFTKLFRNKSSFSPIKPISTIDPKNLEHIPEPLRCADIIRLIAFHSEKWYRRHLRSVCKMWCQAIPTTAEYVITGNTVLFLNVGLTQQQTDQLDIPAPKVHQTDLHGEI